MRESVKGMHVTQISDLIARIRRGAPFFPNSRLDSPSQPAAGAGGFSRPPGGDGVLADAHSGVSAGRSRPSGDTGPRPPDGPAWGRGSGEGPGSGGRGGDLTEPARSLPDPACSPAGKGEGDAPPPQLNMLG